MLGDARCAVLLGLSSPADTGLSVSYVWDSRHVTEPSEGWFRVPQRLDMLTSARAEILPSQ
jgi:hypothetical protein